MFLSKLDNQIFLFFRCKESVDLTLNFLKKAPFGA